MGVSDAEDAFGVTPDQLPPCPLPGQQEKHGEEPAKDSLHKRDPGVVAQGTHGDSNQSSSAKTGTGRGAASLSNSDSPRKVSQEFATYEQAS